MDVPRGFLNKLGEKGIKTWKKRFFEFKDYQLYYYTSENLSTCLGYINLNTAMSVENADKIAPSKEFGFVIILPDRKWHLAAPSDAEREHWVKTIKNLLTSTNNAASIGSNASPMNNSPLNNSEEIPRAKPRRSISQGNIAAVPSFHPMVASKPQSTAVSRRNSIGEAEEVQYSSSPANGRPIPPLPPRKGGPFDGPPPLPGTPPGAAKKKRPPLPNPKSPKGPGMNGPNPNAISTLPPVPARPSPSGDHSAPMGSPPTVPTVSSRPTLQRNVPSSNNMSSNMMSSYKTPLGEFSANSQQGLGPKNLAIPIVMNPSPRTTMQLTPGDAKDIVADPQKRANAAKEILTTEQYFVDCLKIMIDRYMKPLQQSLQSKDRTITYTEADIKTLFSNLEVVIPLNVELLKELTTIVGNWSEQQKIGATFLRMAPFLKMYYEYSIAYNTALDTYNRLVRDQNFAQRLLTYRTDSGINLSLEHLLIMPVQRIPRYVLLLTELSRATPFSHPDKEDLEKAIAKLQEVTQHVNDFIKKAESSKKMTGLEVFIQPHRSLIWDGMLEPKLDNMKGKRDGRRFILFNDLLVHLPQSRAKSNDAMQVHEYQWPMNLVWLNPIKDGVELIGPTKTYVFTYKDQSPEEKQFIAGVTDAIKKAVVVDIPPIERSGFYQFDEERTYEGDWVLGKMHGKGTQVFLHSSQYKGDFKDNMKNGQGVMVWDGGEMYSGSWQDDKPHGQGEMNYPTGDKYDGGWVDGMKFGQGTFLFVNGDVFKGIWAKDVPNGAGFFSAHSGYVYEGNWKDGLYNGEGTLIGPAFKYTGNWLDGLRHGQGKLINGTTEYEGNWKADKRHGKGRWKTTVNGVEMVYEGEWDYDQKNGKGTMTYWDKSVYVGMWKDDKRAGTGTFTFSSDAVGRKVYEGEWANDKMNGKGNLTFNSGEFWDGHFKDNQPHGSMLITNSNTNTKVDAKFEHGKREGRAVIGPATKTNDKWKFEGSIKGNVLDRPGKTDVLVAPPAPHFNLPQIY